MFLGKARGWNAARRCCRERLETRRAPLKSGRMGTKVPRVNDTPAGVEGSAKICGITEAAVGPEVPAARTAGILIKPVKLVAHRALSGKK